MLCGMITYHLQFVCGGWPARQLPHGGRFTLCRFRNSSSRTRSRHCCQGMDPRAAPSMQATALGQKMPRWARFW
nr:hypothetical protein Iba_chr09eCG11640 [Ipomoea batatas]